MAAAVGPSMDTERWWIVWKHRERRGDHEQRRVGAAGEVAGLAAVIVMSATVSIAAAGRIMLQAWPHTSRHRLCVSAPPVGAAEQKWRPCAGQW